MTTFTWTVTKLDCYPQADNEPELCIYVNDKLQGVHYDRMIAPLIKALQEQQAIIQSLTDRVAQLEAK